MSDSSHVDRMLLRRPPDGLPLMYQSWGKLLFMHWPISVDLLRPLIPEQLSIDTFEGRAWIGVVPFTMWGIRASFLPPLPGTSAFHELNVRTYVHYRGVPGVWFFSLDAANRLAVWGARTFYHLPYFNARMSLDQTGDMIKYGSTRIDSRGPDASFKARWMIGEPLPESRLESREFFFTERYCLYALHQSRLFRCRIFHPPWPLQKATVNSYQSNMIESLGVKADDVEPLLHYAEAIDVTIWPLKECRHNLR